MINTLFHHLKLIVFLFTCNIVFTLNDSFATELSKTFTSFSQETTSDLLEKKSFFLSYRNHRRDILWPYPNALEKSFDWGIDTNIHSGSVNPDEFSGVSLSTLIGKKFSSELYSQINVGFHNLENKTAKSKQTITNFQFSTQYVITSTLSANFRYTHDYVYYEMMLPKGVTDYLEADSLYTTFTYKWSKRIKSKFNANWKLLSDSNTKKQYSFDTLYGVSPGWPWIWFGLGMEHLSFTKDLDGYWTPLDFLMIGPRLEAAFTLYKKLSITIAFNANRYHDRDLDTWGNGYYGTVKLQYGKRDELHYELLYTKIETSQNSTKWNSDQVALQMAIFL
ncbi:MAG: hypothetical protein OEW87_14605 [Flavobacteriaceae bacterium]|nr:hypothetical protein [Flavobacteriaceae bacterium]